MDVYDYLFKFIVVGDSNCGKSQLLHRFIENQFKRNCTHTIGVEFGSKIVSVGEKTIKLQIWDTAGQERFRSVTRSYYRGAAAAILVYDVAVRDSYNHLTNWLTDARTLARYVYYVYVSWTQSPDVVIVLVGNKIDLKDEREVTFMEASQFAQENDLAFLETSALTGENVEEAFFKCSRTVLNKIEDGSLDPSKMTSGIQIGDASATTIVPKAESERRGCKC